MKPNKQKTDWGSMIELLIRKYLYIDPLSLKNWKFSVDKWGENCPMCGKLFVPNNYANEFEKKLMETISKTLQQQREEIIKEIEGIVNNCKIKGTDGVHSVIINGFDLNKFLSKLQSLKK